MQDDLQSSCNWTFQLQRLNNSRKKKIWSNTSTFHYENAPSEKKQKHFKASKDLGSSKKIKKVGTWESKSKATWTGLAFLSAMTNTSEGPAGMSIEIMASLFCKESKRGERERVKLRWEIYAYIVWEFTYMNNYQIYTSCSHDKYAYLENHFCSCDILISRAKNLLNLQIIRKEGKKNC